ncbi:MAG: hypothetical protein K5891_07645 [Lachnospiraceae bacterium]|nr:hypothetical protein [Lachnospiraceae bacterium]
MGSYGGGEYANPLPRQQMAELFQTSRINVVDHIFIRCILFGFGAVSQDLREETDGGSAKGIADEGEPDVIEILQEGLSGDKSRHFVFGGDTGF